MNQSIYNQICDKVHQDHPRCVYSVVASDNEIMFYDVNGQPAVCTTVRQIGNAFQSNIVVDLFDYKNKLKSPLAL